MVDLDVDVGVDADHTLMDAFDDDDIMIECTTHFFLDATYIEKKVVIIFYNSPKWLYIVHTNPFAETRATSSQ
jgi:hypothetical protein